MIEIQDLLYQLRLSEQASTQLFEKRLGISLTRYQILLFLLKHSPCNQIAVQERRKVWWSVIVILKISEKCW